MGKFLIVDAHSTIFAWPEMRALHSRRMVLARDALVKKLTAFQDTSEYRVVAVFDGQGSRPTEASEPGGIQVFYSAQGQNADAIIERLVAKYAGIHEITVVTNDRLEQDTATAFGATSISPEIFRMMIEEAEADFQRSLKKRRRE